MKKIFTALLAILVIVSMTACTAPVSATEDDSIATIEAYIDQLMQMEDMQATIEYCKTNNMIHQLEARKDTFVYKYTYTVPVLDNAKELLNSQYGSFESTLSSVAEGLKVSVPAIKTVVWEYYSMDGELITSFSF
ncbi:MAG: DUF4854 domain-containing protein [Oscillospiraceae bacterium]|nr:DUF4854 domain-containing protein [Oscillospiraceae bacterium]